MREPYLPLPVIIAMAQQSAVLEITSEPSHHLVFQNEWVRVFSVLAVGGTAWVEPVTHTVTNPSPQPAKLIALEFKVSQTHP